MKQFTPAIANEIKKKRFFSFSKKYESRYYSGDHREKDIHLLWIETNSLGKAQCYPCALREGDALLAFRPGMKAQNKELMQRWVQVINPENKGEFTVAQLEDEEFTKRYNEAKNEADKREGLGSLEEEDWTDEELLADEELAALCEEEEEEGPAEGEQGR